jgi:hypothetical protein
VVAYIGYSGASLGRTQIQALTCLARAATPLNEAQWERTSPTVQQPPFE